MIFPNISNVFQYFLTQKKSLHMLLPNPVHVPQPQLAQLLMPLLLPLLWPLHLHVQQLLQDPRPMLHPKLSLVLRQLLELQLIHQQAREWI
jgi:hypothetical protein